MDPLELDHAFKSFLRARGIHVASTTPAVGLHAMIEFYATERADGCDTAGDEDMLLFQWGTYDWGHGEHFELDITRQVILPDEIDDAAIWQLSLTHRFPVSAPLVELGADNKWCAAPSELAAFERHIAASPPWGLLADKTAATVELSYQCAG